MRYKLSFLLTTLIVISTISCNKKDEPKPGNANSISNASPAGILFAYKYDLYAYIGDSTFIYDTARSTEEDAIAEFFLSASDPGKGLVDAGKVSLNSMELDRGDLEDSLSYITVFGNFNLTKGIKWDVTGNSKVPAITFTDSSPFPDYTGSFPTHINKATGFAITFDGSTIANADSVLIEEEFTQDSVHFSKTFSANAGTVNLTPADLANLPTGGYLALTIMPFTRTTKVFGGLPYAFIKGKRVVRSVIVY